MTCDKVKKANVINFYFQIIEYVKARSMAIFLHSNFILTKMTSNTAVLHGIFLTNNTHTLSV
jgi:hypothetical protein